MLALTVWLTSPDSVVWAILSAAVITTEYSVASLGMMVLFAKTLLSVKVEAANRSEVFALFIKAFWSVTVPT